ncbi:hypothetical protein GCM10018785_62770 [Streptomyces longispororuber]|uniref:Membrane lipoprotein n=1 Tax=Streptomyces longispororuber TaxID=68230 RepID=A0A919A4G6_9ACTN|nr:hypothetical protein [Streptomyces longispororuber]GHE86489.1 hypothetical protein GCM10018785_62770 [Streptomyces longispororuber]
MTRHRLLLPALLLLAPLALTGCGSEKSEEDGGAGGAPPPGRAELEARARAAQTRVEHVYVTEIDGYRAARQSAGVLNEDGFQVTYVKQDGGQQIALHVDRGTLDEGTCRTVHPPAKSCEKDGEAWYRVTGSRHEYARAENGLRIQVAADRAAVGRAVLRAAAERGDLPSHGDGAPQDPPGAGGGPGAGGRARRPTRGRGTGQPGPRPAHFVRSASPSDTTSRGATGARH